MGTVVPSMESRNLMSWARWAALCRPSTPPLPSLRCCTFSMTASKELTEPLWKNVCGNAWMPRRVGGLNPPAPRGATAVLRISLNAVAMKVFVGRSSVSNWPAPKRLASGGAAWRTRALVHCEPPWQFWQPFWMNSARPAMTSGSVLDTGEMGVRMPLAMYSLMASQAFWPRTLSCRRPPLAGAKAATLGSWVTPSAPTIRPRPPEAPRMLSSKSSSSSKMADQLRARRILASPGAKSACWGIVRRGPAPKIQTTLSLRPKGWQEAQEPQPLLDMRPVMAGPPVVAGSKSPIDV